MTATDGEPFKRPESVLVVVYSQTGKALLLKRADHENFWQSVTGSMHWDESDPAETAIRELKEETGLDAGNRLVNLELSHRYEIYPRWQHRYAPGVTQNTEHAFVLQVPDTLPIVLNTLEHSEFAWLPVNDALKRVTSWTNRRILEKLFNK